MFVILLLSLIAFAGIQLKTVNVITLNGIGYYEFPYGNGVLVTTELVSTSFQSRGVNITSLIYFVNRSEGFLVDSFSPYATNVSEVSEILIYNESYAVINTIYVNISQLIPINTTNLIEHAKANVTILHGFDITGWKFFNNFTMGFPTSNGIVYVSLGVNKSTLITPTKVYTFNGTYVTNVYQTKYGLLVITGIPSIASSISLTPLSSTGSFNSAIYLLGKWNISVVGFEGASLEQNYLIVSNASSTLILNVSNGKVLYKIPVAGTIIPSSSKIVNDTLYVIVGSNLLRVNLTSNQYKVINIKDIKTPLTVSFANHYIIVSGVNYISTDPLLSEINTIIMYYNGTIAYEHSSQSSGQSGHLEIAVYNQGYIYELESSASETQVIVLVISVVATSSTTTTSITTTTSSTSTTTTTTTSSTTTTSTTTTTTTSTTTTSTTSTSSTSTSTLTTTTTSIIPSSNLSTSKIATTTTPSITYHTTSFPIAYVIIGIIIIIVIIALLLLIRKT